MLQGQARALKPDWGSGNRSLQDEAPDWEGLSVQTSSCTGVGRPQQRHSPAPVGSSLWSWEEERTLGAGTEATC